jgi:hypothetical protein
MLNTFTLVSIKLNTLIMVNVFEILLIRRAHE